MCRVTLTHIHLEIDKGSVVLSSQKVSDINLLPCQLWRHLEMFFDTIPGQKTRLWNEGAKSHIQKDNFHLQTSERRVETLGLAFF